MHNLAENARWARNAAAGPACSDAAATVERYATLHARLALAGWALTRTEAGADAPPRFHASRWNMARELADLAAVEQFADRVGARA